jgi:choline dehydrogenase-like flavoprotein
MEGDSVVVIGSGPSGAMAADELVRQGVSVTMLESGSDDPSGLLVRAAGRNLYRRTPKLINESRYVASGHPSTSWFRTLQPGGLSNQWTGAVPRFAPRDFSDGQRIHDRYRWPLDYEHLEPFYERAERLLGITASGDDVPQLPAGWTDHRRSLPPEWEKLAIFAARHGQGLTILPLADGPDFLFARRATAFNSYSNIISKLNPSPNFRLKTNCVALRLEWSGARRRVEAVTYHDRVTNQQERLAATAVVVACGALGSTKLLFDSACPDFPDGLGNNDGVLGRYLHDHPKEWWTVDIDKPITRLSRAAYLTRRPFDDVPPLMSTSWTIGLTSTKEKMLSLLPGKSQSLGVQVFGSMIPSERFYVRPHPTQKDEFGLPQLEISLDFDADVIQNVVDARSWFIDLMGEAGYSCTLNPVVPQCVPGTAVHFGGTARMHQSREFGVIDPWNRLFDVPNVVVVDASSFTTSSEKNPTLTAMALAARAARRLVHDQKHGV